MPAPPLLHAHTYINNNNILYFIVSVRIPTDFVRFPETILRTQARRRRTFGSAYNVIRLVDDNNTPSHTGPINQTLSLSGDAHNIIPGVQGVFSSRSHINILIFFCLRRQRSTRRLYRGTRNRGRASRYYFVASDFRDPSTWKVLWSNSQLWPTKIMRYSASRQRYTWYACLSTADVVSCSEPNTQVWEIGILCGKWKCTGYHKLYYAV